MQGQIPIGALAHVVAAVRRQADGMGVLQVGAQRRERHNQACKRQKAALLRPVKGERGAPVPKGVGKAGKQYKRAQRQIVRRKAEAHGIGPQNRQPHHKQHAQGKPQVRAFHSLLARQQQPGDGRAARQERKQIRNGKQALSPLYG